MNQTVVKGKQELQCFSCLTTFALLLAIIATSVNILGVQRSESNGSMSSDSHFELYYRYQELRYDGHVEIDGVVDSSGSTSIKYQDLYDNIENACESNNVDDTTVVQGQCDGLQALIDGGKMYLGFATTGMILLGVASILLCIWTCAPNKLAFVTHWIITTCVIISAICFWIAFATWQGNFDNNDAVDNMQVILVKAGAVVTIPGEGFTLYDPVLGASAILMILCGIFAIMAACMSCRFSKQRYDNGPQYDSYHYSAQA